MRNTLQLAQMLIIDRVAQRILLAYHKAGNFAGYYTGFLDKVHENEQPEAAARRITLEQSGVTAGPSELRAILTFTAPGCETADEHEFYTEQFSGTPQETETRRAEWFDLNAIPYNNMPADDAIWYPPFLDGRLQRGTFHFDEEMVDLLEYELTEVEKL